MVGHIAQAGSHHHDYNTDDISNCYCLIIGPAVAMAMVMTSSMTTASASKLAVTITLMVASMWVVILTAITW